MRVLLARRFRGNSNNAAHLLEEEGEDPLGEIGEEEEEVETGTGTTRTTSATATASAITVGLIVTGQSSSRGHHAQLQQLPQFQQGQNHRKQPQTVPHDSILRTEKDNADENRLLQQQQQHKPLSVVSPQLLPSPQPRKRRLSKSSAAQEENDCKLRRRCPALVSVSSSSSSSSSTKEEPSSVLDRKPSARETGIVGTSIKSGTTINVACSTAAGKDTIPKEAAFSVTSSSSLSLSSSLPSKQSNAAIKNNKHTMVSGGPGRSQQHGRHGNSRQGEEEEQHHLLNWQYTNRNNAHDESAEIIVQPAIGFDEGPLENDPASARGDVSSASPERGIETETDTENHYNGNSSSSAVRLLDGSFVLGRREESPLVLPTAQSAAATSTSTSTSTSTIRNSYDRGRTASSAPMIAATLPISRRDMSRISPAAGSERGTTYSLQAKSKSWGNGKKKASSVSTAEEARFRHILKKERGLEIREQDGDGNCLFRAISLQVYGDPSMHGDVRKQCMDHMERDQEHFSQFVTGEPFLHYVARTRQDGVHGNNPEIQASSELFNRPIEVFTPENGSSPLNIFHAEYKTGDVPIRLSYHDGNHYNAVIDPLMPTAGLGLGLPGLKPGYADKMQMAKAVAESMNAAADQDQTELQQVLKASQVDFNTTTESDDELQRAIKESQLSAEHMSSNNALSLSDMDATYFELEQAALERSLRSYSQKDEGKKQSASSTKTKLTTAKSRPSTGDSSKPKTIKGDHKTPAVAAAAVAVATSATTSLPCPSQESIPLAAAAASSSVALAAARGRESSSSSPTPPQRLLPVEEYPSSVQELVMNGFPLSSVVKAFDLVGNNFDHMLSLCLSNANRSS